MLDIGWQEIFIIGALAVVVVGPKDLPKAMKTIMQWVRKARGLAREFQSGVEDMVREAELDEIRKEVQEANPANLGAQLKDSIDPTGEMAKEMNLDEVQQTLDDAGRDPAWTQVGGNPADEMLGEDPPAVSEPAPEPDAAPTLDETGGAERKADG